MAGGILNTVTIALLFAGLVSCGSEQRCPKAGAFVVIDTRTQEEFDQGHLPGAILIPYDEIDQRIGYMYTTCNDVEVAAFGPEKDAPILVYCRSGRRSGIAQGTLADMGFTNVVNGGGYINLKGKDPQAIHSGHQ